VGLTVNSTQLTFLPRQNKDKYHKSCLIKFRYCAPVKIRGQLPAPILNGRGDSFQGHVTLTLDRVIPNTIVQRTEICYPLYYVDSEESISSDVNKDLQCKDKDKDKDFSYKDQDFAVKDKDLSCKDKDSRNKPVILILMLLLLLIILSLLRQVTGRRLQCKD